MAKPTSQPPCPLGVVERTHPANPALQAEITKAKGAIHNRTRSDSTGTIRYIALPIRLPIHRNTRRPPILMPARWAKPTPRVLLLLRPAPSQEPLLVFVH